MLSLELSGVDHPDTHKDQALEMAGEGSEDVQHGVDSHAPIGAYQHRSCRLLRVHLSNIR
jgi:hypothetical protein